MNTYVDRFLLHVQSKLKLTSSNHASAESQNLATVLLANANLSQETSASVMASFVLATEGKSDKVTRPIIVDKKRMGKLNTIRIKLESFSQDTINLVEDERLFIKKGVHSLRCDRALSNGCNGFCPVHIYLSQQCGQCSHVRLRRPKKTSANRHLVTLSHMNLLSLLIQP